MPERMPSPARVLVLADQEAALRGHLVAGEERVELVEGQRPRALRADQEQVALAEARLDRRGVERLEHLRLEELADAGDLVARQRGVGVGEQPVGRVVARVGVDRGPALDEAQLLEAEVGVDAAQARAAGGEVGVEQQARAVHGPVVVELDRLLKVLERLDRTVGRLLRDRVVEPGRGVVRVGLLRDVVLAVDQADRASARSRPCRGSCARATGRGRG